MERVLEGIHKIAVADMVAEASVRKHIRELYMKYAVVSTGTNCNGNSSVNNHSYPHACAYTHDMQAHLYIHTCLQELLLQTQFRGIPSCTMSMWSMCYAACKLVYYF